VGRLFAATTTAAATATPAVLAGITALPANWAAAAS